MFSEFLELQTDKLVDFIYNDRKSVPYLYVNLKTYDKNNANIKIFVDDEKGSIIGVALLYYDCLHFYTSFIETYPKQHIINLVKDLKPRVIMLQDALGQSIKNDLNVKYMCERNCIIDMDDIKVNETFGCDCTLAKKDELDEIADLLLSEEEYSMVYDRNVLINQMQDRYDNGISRYVVIKRDGNIVATCSTYAESDDMALIGGVMVHREWRNKGFASYVEKYLCKLMTNENKSKIGFVNIDNIPSISLHKKLGAKVSSIYTKLIQE